MPPAAYVIFGSLLVAVGLTLFLVRKLNVAQADPAPAVAQVPTDPNPAPAGNAPPPAPATGSGPPAREVEEHGFPTVPVRPPVAGEEDVPDTVPGAGRPTTKAGSDGPPDIEGLPRIPQLRPPTARSGAPKGSVAPKSADPVAAKPERPKPADPLPADAGPVGDGQIPPALLGRLKAATVFIKVQFDGKGASGSGFVLQVEDDHALIVTNDHVAVPLTDGGPAPARMTQEVVFHSGRKNEFSRRAELVATDAEHDLAILRVSGVRGTSDFPAPLNATDPPPLSETTPIYIIGFPFGRGLATSGANPAVTISKGTITSLREDEAGDIVFIQIDADSNPGNSGGPVVDGRGRLVGVLRGGKPGTAINFAIPQIELARMLTGRVGDLEFQLARSLASAVEMDIRGTLIDPLDRVKSASVRVVRADALKGKPSVGSNGKWAALENSQPTELRVNGRSVNARVELPVRASDRGRIDIYFQPVCVDRQGQTTYFAPVSQTLSSVDGPRGGIPNPSFPGGTGGAGTSPPPGFPGGPGGPGLPAPPPLPTPPGAGPGDGRGGPGGPPMPPPLPMPPGAGGPGRPGGPPAPPPIPQPPGVGGVPGGPMPPGGLPGPPKRPGRPGSGAKK